MTTQSIFSNTTEIVLDQEPAPNLFLTLEGEIGNANDLQYILHIAHASNDEGAAFGRGLLDTNLTTRSLDYIELNVGADAIDGANFAYGFDNVLLESERNNNGVDLYFDINGSTKLSEDPTFVDEPVEEIDPDPSFGFDNSTAYLTEFGDYIDLNVNGSAVDWTNQAVAYGIRGGNSKIDKLTFDEVMEGSNLRGLRPSLVTYEGDDTVLIRVNATNNGEQYSEPLSADAVEGKQRAVGLFQTVVDLGEGKDEVIIRTTAEVGDNSTEGASSVASSNDIFGGLSSTEQTLDAAAACDIYESAVFAGGGADTINIYNGWESDLFLDNGDDTVTLTAGKNIYIHGGDGTDLVEFEDEGTTYEGTEDGRYKFNTIEGNVFVGLDVERVTINDESVNLLEQFGGIIGTRGDDNINGTNQDNLIDALDGNDYVRGVSGKDIIYGYLGNDTLLGGAGNDEVYGDDGNDELYGGKGNDFVTGKSGKDILYGDNNNDTLLGMNGNDVIYGGKGKDYIKGGGGKDVMYGGKKKDTFALSLGKDKIKDFKLGETVLIKQENLGSGLNYKDKKDNLMIKTNEGVKTIIEGVNTDDFLSGGGVQII